MCTRRFVLAPVFFSLPFLCSASSFRSKKKLQILLSSRSSIDRSPYAAVRRALCKRFVRCTRADTENGRIRIDCPNDVGNASKRAMVATNGFQGARIKVNVIRFLSFLLSLSLSHSFFQARDSPAVANYRVVRDNISYGVATDQLHPCGRSLLVASPLSNS